MTTSQLRPMLTVRNARAAVDFYGRAFGAKEVSHFETPTGQIVAGLELPDGLGFSVVDENPAAQNLSPQALGGTTVRLSLIVDDPDTLAAKAVAAGATELFPLLTNPMECGRVEWSIHSATSGS